MRRANLCGLSSDIPTAGRSLHFAHFLVATLAIALTFALMHVARAEMSSINLDGTHVVRIGMAFDPVKRTSAASRRSYAVLLAGCVFATGCGHPAASASSVKLADGSTGPGTAGDDSGDSQDTGVTGPVWDGSRGCPGTGAKTPSGGAWTGPSLSPGVWTNIDPAGVDVTSTYGTTWIEIDPNHPQTLYLTIDQKGMWRSTDAGRTWKSLGNPSQTGDTATSYLDSPIAVRVDPNDSTHLYATQGVRGNTLGFWVSHDSGATWTKPAGFQTVAAMVADGGQSQDVTSLAVDPADFCHILVSYHSPWKIVSGYGSGIIESHDQGETWTVHVPPRSNSDAGGPAWIAGSKAVHFLHDPATGQGDGNTWLVSDDNAFWRTSDAGAHWTQVWPGASPHGGADIYYTKAGVLYAGASNYPIRSKDNGLTWEALNNGVSYSYYYTVYGDGNALYTNPSLRPGSSPAPYITSAEGDGLSWSPYKGGTQTFVDGPFLMRYDAVNGVMYSANWKAGLWALKVAP
jgi:hypothetical protein